VGTAKLFSGDVTFHDCREVVEFGRGGSDDAGFVQVIRGRVRDAERMRTLNDRYESVRGDFRPDLIGGLVALQATSATPTRCTSPRGGRRAKANATSRPRNSRR
jgi:hypothetical protein